MSVKVPVAVPAELSPEEKQDVKRWRVGLVIGATLFAVLAAVGGWSAAQPETTVVTTTKRTVTTTTSSGLPDALVSTFAGGAAALLVAAAFYGRIKKFSFAGAEAEFGPETALDETQSDALRKRAQVLVDAVQQPERADELVGLGDEIARRKRQAGLDPVELADVAVSAAARRLNLIH